MDHNTKKADQPDGPEPKPDTPKENEQQSNYSTDTEPENTNDISLSSADEPEPLSVTTESTTEPSKADNQLPESALGSDDTQPESSLTETDLHTDDITAEPENQDSTSQSAEAETSSPDAGDSTNSASKLPDFSTLSDTDTPPVPVPGVIVSGADNDAASPSAVKVSGSKPKLSKKKKFLLAFVGTLIVLTGGAAAFYYGYYMNPAQVWKESLSNTGLGYNKLVGYLNSQSQVHYTGYTENGTFALKLGSTNFSGSVQSAYQGNNATGSLKVDTGEGNIDLELRSLEVPGASQPDDYIQINGIKAFSNLFGAVYGPKVSAYDGKWIVIDHNLVEDLTQQIAQQNANAKSSPKLTWKEVNSFLQAAGKVNQTYVFSTNKATAVTKIVKVYGRETVDGRSTIHYKIGFVNANVKAYVNAMCSVLSGSGLGAYLSQEHVLSDFNSGCKEIASTADKIKSSDTVDVWADINSRLLYKLRVSDPSVPAENYVDIGLNYKGGSTYPFFVKGNFKDKSNTSTFLATVTLNSQTNAVSFVMNINSPGQAPINMNVSLNAAPSKAPVHVTAPPNAIPITTVLNDLGLGQYLTELESLGANATGLMPTSSSGSTDNPLLTSN